MIRRPILAAIAALALAAAAHAPAAAEPRILPDSTVLDIWQLPNGLRVVVRHVSIAKHVALTLAWPSGSESDPKGQKGRAALLAELLLTAPTGEVPERTRAEMATIRPAGWGAGVSPRVTQLTEVATLEQFPGVLHELAQRLRGVRVDEAVLRSAHATLAADLQRQRTPTSNVELYQATRELSHGGYDPAEADAGLKALAKLKPAEVQAQMTQAFAARGAVLSLAGNLGNINLAALIENEFGKIPEGTGAPAPPSRRPARGVRDLARPGLPEPAGALAIIAPALEDSLHPSFYLSTLFLGGYCQREWRGGTGPLTTRFQYSIFDDPDLARFYPPPGPGTAADSALDAPFNLLVSRMGAMVFPPESYDGVLRGVSWLLGGSLPPEIMVRAARDANVLATLASNQAVRELWGGEPFWTEYRRQLSPQRVREFHNWVSYLLDPANRVKVLIRPR